MLHFGFSDADHDQFAAVEITTTPSSGSLRNHGFDVVSGQFISKSDILGFGLTFTPETNSMAGTSFTFQVQDDGGTDNGGVDTDPTPRTLTIAIEPPPELHDVAPTVRYGGSALVLSPQITVSDQSSTTLMQASVMIADFVSGDELSAVTTGTNIAATFFPDGMLSLDGTDTLDHYQQVLDTVSYHFGGADPTFGGTDTTRTLLWNAFDGLSSSTSLATTLSFEENVACYCRGTLIATEKGEVPVQNLKIGDQVLTKSGELRPIKWIGRRSYNGRFALGNKRILPVCFKAGALADNVPRRDLWISPQHAVYVEGVLIEAKDLVNGETIVQAERIEKVEYFHIELDSHDIIIAEGALSESFIDDDSRGIFQNVQEYHALYPKETVGPALYCAPRCCDGFAVEVARRKIEERAGLRGIADDSGAGRLRGYVDLISPTRIVGWAQNERHPEAPVCLDIIIDGECIDQVLANRYREDLDRAGLGSGKHSFCYFVRPDRPIGSGLVEIRRSLDNAPLPASKDAQRRVSAQTVGSTAPPIALDEAC